VYSVTSYKNLYYDGLDCDRHNRLHPADPPKVPYVQQVLEGSHAPVVAASDYVRAVPLAISPWLPKPYVVLGTDGFGRSDSRQALRRFFEVDAENIALAALTALAQQGKFPQKELPKAIQKLGLDPDHPNPVLV